MTDTSSPTTPGGTPAERLRAVGTAALSSELRKRGYHDVFIEGVRSLAPGALLAGPARTIRFVPFRPDLAAERAGGLNPQKRAFDAVGPGEVLVIEARGLPGTGTFGDILALRARARGAEGVVTDGGVRDSGAVATMGLPLFTNGSHPSVLGRRHVPWETDVVVACGGAAVVPGDFVVGDDDGVLVVPAALVEEVLEGAERQEREDAWIAARVEEGESLDGLFPLGATWRTRFEAETEGGAR